MLGSSLSADFVTDGRCLILTGKTGRGKTHLAVAIAYRVLERGRLFRLDGPSMRTRHLALDSKSTSEASSQPGRISGTHSDEEIAMSVDDSPSIQESIMVGQMSIRYLIDGTATGGMGVFELGVPPGSNVPPPHSHTANEECVYVLAGVLRYAVADVTRDLRPGDWMHTPRGSVHQFSNPHNELARALIVLTPDIGAQYFRDVAAVVNVVGPPDRAKLLGVMSRYGLVPAPVK